MGPTIGYPVSIAAGVLNIARREFGFRYPPSDFHMSSCPICNDEWMLSPDDPRLDLHVKTDKRLHCACVVWSAAMKWEEKAVEFATDTGVSKPKWPGKLFDGQQKAIDTIRRLLVGEDRPGVIVVAGKPGVGKTVLAQALYYLFWPFSAFPPALWRAVRYDQVAEEANRLARFPVHILDDVGHEADERSYPAKMLIKEVLDKAQDPRRRDYYVAILTTNHSRERLAEILGEQVASRLCQERGAAWILLSKDDAKLGGVQCGG